MYLWFLISPTVIITKLNSYLLALKYTTLSHRLTCPLSKISLIRANIGHRIAKQPNRTINLRQI